MMVTFGPGHFKYRYSISLYKLNKSLDFFKAPLDGVLDRTAHLIITILVSAFLVAFGTAGYVLIEGWPMLDSLYMTVITFSTVGFGEIRQLSPTGRIFTLILIVLGVGVVAYVIGNVIQFLVEGRIRLILGRHKLDKKIDRLNSHYIVDRYQN